MPQLYVANDVYEQIVRRGFVPSEFVNLAAKEALARLEKVPREVPAGARARVRR